MKELSPLETLNEIKDKFFVKDGNSTIGDFGLLRRLDVIETALKNYEEHEKILKDYDFSLANFREACFTLAQFRGEGFTGIEKQINKLRKLRENITTLESRAFYDDNSNSDRMCYSIILKNGRKEYISRDLYKLLKEICYND